MGLIIVACFYYLPVSFNVKVLKLSQGPESFWKCKYKGLSIQINAYIYSASQRDHEAHLWTLGYEPVERLRLGTGKKKKRKKET